MDSISLDLGKNKQSMLREREREVFSSCQVKVEYIHSFNSIIRDIHSDEHNECSSENRFLPGSYVMCSYPGILGINSRGGGLGSSFSYISEGGESTIQERNKLGPNRQISLTVEVLGIRSTD